MLMIRRPLITVAPVAAASLELAARVAEMTCDAVPPALAMLALMLPLAVDVSDAMFALRSALVRPLRHARLALF